MNLLGGAVAVLVHLVAHEEVEGAEELGAPELGLQEHEPVENPCWRDRISCWGVVAPAWPRFASC